MNEQEQAVRLVALGIVAMVGGYIASDARRRGRSKVESLSWGAAVMLLMIVFLPIYLYMRHIGFKGGKVAGQEAASPCPYCGYLNKSGANFCEKCNRQLKSSGEIHKK